MQAGEIRTFNENALISARSVGASVGPNSAVNENRCEATDWRRLRF